MHGSLSLDLHQLPLAHGLRSRRPGGTVLMRVSTFSLAVALSAASTVAVAAAPQPHGGPKATTHGNGSKSTGTTDSGATTTTTPTTAPPLNPIAQKISNNHGLLPKVTALLPKGMSLDRPPSATRIKGRPSRRCTRRTISAFHMRTSRPR